MFQNNHVLGRFLMTPKTKLFAVMLGKIRFFFLKSQFFRSVGDVIQEINKSRLILYAAATNCAGVRHNSQWEWGSLNGIT